MIVFVFVSVFVSVYEFLFLYVFEFVFVLVFVHLWWLEALLGEHGVPLAVLKVEPSRGCLHWHQGRHLSGLQLL